MKNTKKTLGALVAVVLASVGVAQATPMTTDNLADLVANGGSLSIGDKTFSGFSFTDDGLTSFNASQITVTASIIDGVYYLTWGGNMSLAGTSAGTADLLLGYTVTANPGTIVAIDQNYTGSATGGTLAVDETVKTASGQVVGYSHLDPANLSDTDPSQNPLLTINPPQSVLYVTKDIAFALTSQDGGLITISQVEQSFHQATVPDGGTTAVLLGAALCGLALLRRKLAA